jgi:DnaJ-class molecular chaperone
MTPYAILLCKSTDSDDTIRAAYHVFARATHADFHKHKREEWERYTGAYTTIKTLEAREAWEARRVKMSGLCGTCHGSGVTGTRMFKGVIKVCTVCSGEGREARDTIKTGGKGHAKV